LSKAVIVDDTPKCYSGHKENGIPIKSFIDDKNDRELDNLKEFLVKLS
jgi:TFIIF-interacting CTD phosphatase-like protein